MQTSSAVFCLLDSNGLQGIFKSPCSKLFLGLDHISRDLVISQNLLPEEGSLGKQGKSTNRGLSIERNNSGDDLLP